MDLTLWLRVLRLHAHAGDVMQSCIPAAGTCLFCMFPLASDCIPAHACPESSLSVSINTQLQAAVPHTPIVLGRAALRGLRPCEVLVRRWANPSLPVQWFRLLDEDQPVVVGPCGHFFEADEYEMVSLWVA
jgi:hypothetical protein